jgi:hypothetical protein
MDLAHLLQLYYGSWEKDAKLIIMDNYGTELYNDTCDINKRRFVMDKKYNDEMSYYIWSCEVDGFTFENDSIVIWLKKDKRLESYLYN